MKYFKIIIHDPRDFKGNPLTVTIKGIVHGPLAPNWQEADVLVEVKEPFKYKEEQVQYLTLSPRYKGDTIEDIQTKHTTVGIGRVLPGHTVDSSKRYSQEDIEYWAIGDIGPIEN